VARVVGRVDAAGNIDTTTALTNVYSANNIRSVVSTDGQNIWVSGASSGINYTTLGSSTATNVVSFKTRDLTIYKGQLYFGTDSTSASTIVSQFATALPTSTATPTALTGLPAPGSSNSTNQFIFEHLGTTGSDPDTLYVADDTGSALTKYSLVSGSWVATGKVGSGSDDYTGLTAIQNGSTITLYATIQRGSSKDQLVSIVDSSGYDGSITGATVNVVASATDSTNFGFLGVSAVPTPEPGSIAMVGAGLACGLLRRRRCPAHA
jgi:hypothetical protein